MWGLRYQFANLILVDTLCDTRWPSQDQRPSCSLLLGRATWNPNQGHRSSRLNSIAPDSHLLISHLQPFFQTNGLNYFDICSHFRHSCVALHHCETAGSICCYCCLLCCACCVYWKSSAEPMGAIKLALIDFVSCRLQVPWVGLVFTEISSPGWTLSQGFFQGVNHHNWASLQA